MKLKVRTFIMIHIQFIPHSKFNLIYNLCLYYYDKINKIQDRIISEKALPQVTTTLLLKLIFQKKTLQ